MAASATPFLMFKGDAEEAMEFYVSLFDDGEILSLERYGGQEPSVEGAVKHGAFWIAGQRVMVIDSPAPHPFSFTPSFSFFIDFDNEAELERVHDELMAGGEALMPKDDYGFSKQFAWVRDRFGVSWQLNAP